MSNRIVPCGFSKKLDGLGVAQVFGDLRAGHVQRSTDLRRPLHRCVFGPMPARNEDPSAACMIVAAFGSCPILSWGLYSRMVGDLPIQWYS